MLAWALVALGQAACARPVETRRIDLRLLSQSTLDVPVHPWIPEAAMRIDARVRLDRTATGGPAVIMRVLLSDTCEHIQRSTIEETVVISREGAAEVREPPAIRVGQRSLGLYPCHTRPLAGVRVETHWSRWIVGTKSHDICQGFSGSTGADGVISIPLDALRYDACVTSEGRRWKLRLRIMDEAQDWPPDIENAVLGLLAPAKPVVPPSPGPEQ